jgi:hypothetical protein
VAELLAEMRWMVPRLTSRADLLPRQYGACCLARCSRLLSAMVELRRLGYSDVVGLPLRSLLECWYLGMYTLFAPGEAIELLRGAHLYQLGHLDDSWEGLAKSVEEWKAIGPPVNPKSINWADLRDCVGALLVEHGEEGARNTSERLYEVLYRSESAMSVHAGIGTLIGHMDPGETGVLGLLEVRKEPEDGEVRIRSAASLVGTLAHFVARTFGFGTARIEKVAAELVREAAASFGYE